MPPKLKSLKPVEETERQMRRRFTFKDELILAVLPTLTVLIVLVFMEVLNRQRFLFSALASSAFLIYLDPLHGTNAIRTLVISHLGAATAGLVTFKFLGPGYFSGASAMVFIILFMILLDAVHPPAVSTSLIFAFRAGHESNLLLFALAVGVTAVLILLERQALWLLALYTKRREE